MKWFKLGFFAFAVLTCLTIAIYRTFFQDNIDAGAAWVALAWVWIYLFEEGYDRR